MPRARGGGAQGGRFQLLEQVLPLLLLGDEHLAAKDRLACLCISKGIAELVLRHTPRLKLTLGGYAAAVSAGGTSSSSSGSSSRASTTNSSTNSSRGTRASVKAVQQLAAQSSDVALSLQGGLLRPALCLWRSITSIHLEGVSVSPTGLSSLSLLQLHKLPHLHTLSLQACRVDKAGSSARTGPQQHGPAAASRQTSNSIRTLSCMRCTPSSASLVRMALPLVDPGQLQTLITDDRAAADLLDQLPALQELQLLQGPGPVVNDHTLQLLLSHPGLTRVSLPVLDLHQDYSDQSCNWASLKMPNGVTVCTLAALPLASIQSCTITGVLGDQDSGDPVDQALENINRCPNLVFEPNQLHWRPAEPLFSLVMFAYTQEKAARLIKVVLRHYAGGALATHVDTALPAPMLAGALTPAPPTLTTLAATIHPPEDWDDMEGDHEGALMHLPTHINHVLLHMFYSAAETEDWLRGVGWYMKGVTRPLTLTLLNYKASYRWPADTEQAVREWLALYASSQVQVDFQCGSFQAGS